MRPYELGLEKLWMTGSLLATIAAVPGLHAYELGFGPTEFVIGEVQDTLWSVL